MGRVSVEEMANRLRSLKTKIQPKVEQLILSSPEVKHEKKEEFLKGRRPDGTLIGSYSTTAYAKAKYALNKRAGFRNVDLFVTGRFVNQLIPYRASGNEYLFSNRLAYGNDLIRKYGADILGENQSLFNEIQRLYIAPDLIKFIKQQLA